MRTYENSINRFIKSECHKKTQGIDTYALSTHDSLGLTSPHLHLQWDFSLANET